MTGYPAYGVVRPVTPVASVLLENNPGSMTLEGTNTWLLRDPSDEASIVVDPGYEDPAHLTRILDAGPISLILITHRHADHAEGAPWLAERSGAPVRAFAAELCADAPPLADGELIEAAGLTVRVLHTPGHTDDSVCLYLADAGGHRDSPGAHAGWGGARLDAPDGGGRDLAHGQARHDVREGDSRDLPGGRPGAHERDRDREDVRRRGGRLGSDVVLTGDSILGRGTTVISALGPYLATLRRLAGLPGETLALPGHGPELPDVSVIAAEYLAHRQQRLGQVRAALDQLGQDATARQVVEVVYADVDRSLWGPAEWSVRAQLDYLRTGR